VYNIISNINTTLEVLIMQGHLFKYKDESGNWCPIPVLIQDMYHAYVDYCRAHNIEENNIASEEVYYRSVGELATLTDSLNKSYGAMQELSAAIGEGALPISMGGTGINIDTAKFTTLVSYLATPVTEGGAGLISRTAVESLIEECLTNANQAISNAFNGGIIAYGTNTPQEDESLLGPNVKYFFQYE
jgi:hypothetical protein